MMAGGIVNLTKRGHNVCMGRPRGEPWNFTRIFDRPPPRASQTAPNEGPPTQWPGSFLHALSVSDRPGFAPQGRGKLNVRTRKTAISARVMEASGQ